MKDGSPNPSRVTEFPTGAISEGTIQRRTAVPAGSATANELSWTPYPDVKYAEHESPVKLDVGRRRAYSWRKGTQAKEDAWNPLHTIRT